MQMLIVSDLHYALKQFDWVTNAAGEYDVVVLAGDHLDIRSNVEPDAQIAMVLEYFARISARTTLVACSGNHDLDAENDLGERTASWLQRANAEVRVDGASIETDDIVITVCPWWDGPRTRDRFAEDLAAEAARVGDRMWIWVYHAPPDQSPTSWTGRRYYGDTELNGWIEQYAPAIVVCGHVHESPFVDDGGWSDRIGATLVLNAGRQSGPVPAHVIVDTDAGVVTWSAAGEGAELSLVRR
jgi:Icc-related predicted phosphoesterase